MKKRRWLSLLVATLMATTGIMGCSTKQVEQTKVAETVTKEEKKEETAKSKDTEEIKLASPSWKTDTSEHTIKWFVAYDWYGKKFNPEVNLTDKWIYEETGIKIEFQTGDIDKLNVLIKTNQLPDIITVQASSTERKLLENNGMVLPLNELSKKYAPELYAPQSEKEWYTAKDGNWYSICNFYYGNDNIADNNGYFETHNQNFVRDDIMKQIGASYDDLRTKEGFLNTLRKVKEADIIYNGNKVVPYMGLMTDYLAEQIAEQFGSSQEDKDGKFQSIYRTPEFLESVLFLNQMYREGLMTDETFTMSPDQIKQKSAAGQFFATTRWTNVSSTRASLYAADPNAKYLYAGLIKGDNHDSVAVPAKSNGGWTATLINKNTSKPDRAIQLLAFLSQEEAIYNAIYGMDGYTIEDGKVVRNPERVKLEAENPTEYNATYGDGIGWLTDYTFIQGTFNLDEEKVWGEDITARTRDPQVLIYDDKCFTDVAPEGGSEEAAILARINEYKTQALGRVITASSAEKCESLYKEALAEMDKLGLKQLEEYQNTLFQENKAKLGLKFAHPFNQ